MTPPSQKPSECCRECSNDPDGMDYSSGLKCLNPSCECHSEPKSEDIKTGYMKEFKGIEIDDSPLPSFSPKPTWEERARKRLHEVCDLEDIRWIDGDTKVAATNNIDFEDGIINLIRSLLEEERTKMVERIEKLKKEEYLYHDDEYHQDEHGKRCNVFIHNQALSDVLSILNQSDGQ